MNFHGIFLKFGEEEHICQLQEEGLIFCNTIKYFADLEHDAVRGDVLEKATYIDNSNDALLRLQPLDKPTAEYMSVKLSKFAFNREDAYGNLFCMYSINMNQLNEGEKYKVDERLKEKYEFFLIIKDVPLFLKRIQQQLDNQKLAWEHHLIEYKDFLKFRGERTIFQKDISYSYQQEFRLLIYNSVNKPVKIAIGNIADISEKLSVNILENGYFIKQFHGKYSS